MLIGNKRFDIENKHYIMGILNVTPDSFSDGGYYNELDKGLSHVASMIEQGASIIDVGGMSTRPGHIEISVDEEIERVLPIIKALKNQFDVPISIDTYRSQVVEAVAPYIDMVNDINGLSYDGCMVDVIAKHDLSLCIMAHRAHQGDIQPIKESMEMKEAYLYDGNEYINKVIYELEEIITKALNGGIPKDKIMVDGGVGFGKTYEQNLAVIHHTNRLANLGYPLLMATSNKGFMREITGNQSPNKSHETVTTTIMGAIGGASFFRVHDVEANKRSLDMYRAINTCTMPQIKELLQLK